VIVLAALAAHEHAMAEARERGDLRDVHGRQYPVPEGDFMRWEAEQREIRRRKAREFLQSRMGARQIAESAFA
jgi:hypothetical protein